MRTIKNYIGENGKAYFKVRICVNESRKEEFEKLCANSSILTATVDENFIFERIRNNDTEVKLAFDVLLGDSSGIESLKDFLDLLSDFGTPIHRE